MLDNFQLAAIVKQSNVTNLFSIPLHQKLQDELARQWNYQYAKFLNDMKEVDFNAGYKPEQHELFRLEDFRLPDWLVDENSTSIANLEAITRDDQLVDKIKGIVAFVVDDQDREVLLFQNFIRSHVIRPGRFLFLQNNTYQSVERPGLALDRKLAAVFQPDEQKLLFHNFRVVNTFLPLAHYYNEASEQEIRELLAHDRLAPEDADALAMRPNQWFRKRFAMLKDSRVLDQYSAHQIKKHSMGYQVDVKIKNDRIVFPAEKSAAKRLLQFLNEEIFRGAITETLYETNSKREAD